jgi:hypothetical protein
MLLSPNKNVGQDLEIKIANRLFENVTFQIFGDDSNKPILFRRKLRGD